MRRPIAINKSVIMWPSSNSQAINDYRGEGNPCASPGIDSQGAQPTELTLESTRMICELRIDHHSGVAVALPFGNQGVTRLRKGVGSLFCRENGRPQLQRLHAGGFAIGGQEALQYECSSDPRRLPGARERGTHGIAFLQPGLACHGRCPADYASSKLG